MTVTEKDIKLLWGRAAGICSRPGCDKDLTTLLDPGQGHAIGGLAHAIGRRHGAARSVGTGEPDTYHNLILLCPDDQLHIDNAPEGTYPESLVREWKQKHETRIRALGATAVFQSFDELADAVSRLLVENRLLFEALGPKSEAASTNPSSNLHQIWDLRRRDRIVPNNQKIVNMVSQNDHLLSSQALIAFHKFRMHAEAFERHVDSPLDSYPLFPAEFAKEFNRHV